MDIVYPEFQHPEAMDVEAASSKADLVALRTTLPENEIFEPPQDPEVKKPSAKAKKIIAEAHVDEFSVHTW